ncbi:2-dehydropantoate 2-reductase [Arvimicrobium flavum]|uniref:2-dehydropantoate 2-reductase n=1 Tax=Arvimicrobium flavum TaxID=3393320 RepID=UPI00237BCADB|nr:2-dehydropantoate 2-reductase [Mesorhizobium shangrilense]
MEKAPLIAVFGAGSIGCYVGGRLAAAGARVRFIGRERMAKQVATEGLRLTDHLGADRRVPPGEVDYRTDPAALGDADLVLVTVKAGDTEAAAASVARYAPGKALVVSFQNGIGNEEILRRALPGRTVLGGMVPFNVVQLPGSTFKQASGGALDVEKSDALAPFLAAFEAAGLPLHQHAEFRPIQWGKLLLNLNNAISGLSALPLREELSQRAYRRCLALAQREALAAMKAAGIRPAKLTPLPPSLVPWLLELPDWLFLRLASNMLAIDPAARSSMIDALDSGRRTDVDWLNGEIVRLAERNGVPASVNRRLVELIHESVAGPRRRWSGDDLLRELRAAR